MNLLMGRGEALDSLVYRNMTLKLDWSAVSLFSWWGAQKGAQWGHVPLCVAEPFCLFILHMAPGPSAAACGLTFEIQPLSGNGWLDGILRSHMTALFSCWTQLAPRIRGLLRPHSSIFIFSIYQQNLGWELQLLLCLYSAQQCVLVAQTNFLCYNSKSKQLIYWFFVYYFKIPY